LANLASDDGHSDPYFLEVAEWLHRKSGFPREELRPSTRLADVVDDSLAMVEFIMELEEAWKVSVPDRLFETKVDTLQDLADFIRETRQG
jgi:acyl carrier protein